jgi:hypothetical protein
MIRRGHARYEENLLLLYLLAASSLLFDTGIEAWTRITLHIRNPPVPENQRHRGGQSARASARALRGQSWKRLLQPPTRSPFEREYFHWVTNRALRGLIEEGRVHSERRQLSTGSEIKLVWPRSYRFYKRAAD